MATPNHILNTISTLNSLWKWSYSPSKCTPSGRVDQTITIIAYLHLHDATNMNKQLLGVLWVRSYQWHQSCWIRRHLRCVWKDRRREKKKRNENKCNHFSCLVIIEKTISPGLTYLQFAQIGWIWREKIALKNGAHINNIVWYEVTYLPITFMHLVYFIWA